MHIGRIFFGSSITLEVDDADHLDDVKLVAAILAHKTDTRVMFTHNDTPYEISPIVLPNVLRGHKPYDLKLRNHCEHLRKQVWLAVEINQKLLQGLEEFQSWQQGT